jgi:hypothetical protein
MCLIEIKLLDNDHDMLHLLYALPGPFPHSRLITGFVTRLTRRVPLLEQDLLTLPKHMSLPPVFTGVRVTRSLVLYVCFLDRCLSFCTLYLAIVLSVLLRYTDSDCPFGIFKSSLGYVGLCQKNIYYFWIKLFYFILEVASIDH